MIEYRVSCTLHKEHAQQWEQYFLEQHIDDVMNTACFERYEFKKELTDEKDSVTYITSYYCKNIETLNRYNERFAPALKEDVMSKFDGLFSAKRSISYILEK